MFIYWVPSYCSIEENEKADITAKKAIRERRIQTTKWTNLSHFKKQITKEKKAQLLA